MDPAPNRGFCNEPAVGGFPYGGCVAGTEQGFADSLLCFITHNNDDNSLMPAQKHG